MRSPEVKIGKKLTALREELGLSRRCVGELANVSDHSIAAYEGDRVSPSLDSISRLADFYSVSVDYILGRVDEKEEGKPFIHSYRKEYEEQRREIFESRMRIRKKGQPFPPGIESPWPYNLVEVILGIDPEGIIVSAGEYERLSAMAASSLDPDDRDWLMHFFEKAEEIYPLSDMQEQALWDALETLSPRQKEMILERFRDGMMLEEIGKKRGLTRERIRQIVARGLRKLRHQSRVLPVLKGMDHEIERVKAKREQLEEQLRATERLEKELACAKGRLEAKGLTGMTVPLRDVHIRELDLSVRSYNCLMRAGINSSMKVLDAIRSGEILNVRNLGKRSLDDILLRMSEYYGREVMKGGPECMY